MFGFSSLFDFDSSVFDDVLERRPEVRDITCPNCSQRLSDLKETFFVGCPECYNIFAPYIKELATSYHGRGEHIGKVPLKVKETNNISKELDELARLEKQAVLDRDYIRADEIKRKIKALRGQE